MTSDDESRMAYRLRGVVRHVHRAEGYGFILATDHQQYFVRPIDDLCVGDSLTFAAPPGPNGWRAESIRVVERRDGRNRGATADHRRESVAPSSG